MVTMVQMEDSNALFVDVEGELTKEDYELLLPEVEGLIDRFGSIAILVELGQDASMSAGAIWEDIKFDVEHYKDVERVAIVGDTRWEKTMAKLCKPFTKAEVKYFPTHERRQASEWVKEVATQNA